MFRSDQTEATSQIRLDPLPLQDTCPIRWRRGVVVSGVRRMNEVNPRRATHYQVGTWMGDRLRAGTPSQYVTSQLGQLSLASLRGRIIEYQLQLGYRGGNVTSVGWQVTLYGPIWHVSSRNGEACCELLSYLYPGHYSSILTVAFHWQGMTSY